MIHSLTSADLTIQVRQKGAELCSIFSNSTKTEYLWQGNPEIWSGQAPVLFPIIGALKEGITRYKDASFEIPKHGLVRNSDQVKLLEKTENTLRFGFKWNEETFEKYPFKFELEIIFTLKDNELVVHHLIRNLGKEEMLYSLGGHPAFNCPLHEGESYEDYELKFEKTENAPTWLINEAGLQTGKSQPMLNNTDILRLEKNLFDQDALIFKNLESRKVILQHRIKGPILSVEFSDFEYLGIWAKPAAPFVCIEPWLGIADSNDGNQLFSEKEGILSLAADQEHRKSFSITILD